MQEEFRRNLIAAWKSTYPDLKSDAPWCSVLGHFFPDDETMRAAHIFSWAEGQVAMDEIVGREVEKVEELSEIRNGIMLSKYAVKLSNAASQQEIDTWAKSEPEEYKIRVTNSEAKGMKIEAPSPRL